jgi:putative component of toxin-antitoxin plasmid stabilization module
MTKSTRGGSRANSGRKRDPNKKIAITKKLDRRIVAYLKQCDNATEVIETAIEKSDGYRVWFERNPSQGEGN